MWKAVLLSCLALGVPTERAPNRASENEKQEMAIPQLTRDVLSRIGTPVALTEAERKLLTQVVASVKKDPSAVPKQWGPLVESAALRSESVPILEIISLVMKEAILEQQEDLKYWLKRLEHQNKLAGALSEYLEEMRKKIRTDKGHRSAKISGRSVKITREADGEGEPFVLGPVVIQSAEQWRKELKKWEEELASVEKDAQLANIDLQNALARQQKTVQVMSNVSKQLHDQAMAIIKKIG